MQSIAKAALKYFGFFILLYGAMTLVSLIPSVGAACNTVYRTPTESILQALFSKAYLQLKEVEDNPNIIRAEFASKEIVKQQTEDARLSGKTKASIQGKDFEISFYNLFLSFYLFLVALILLSPLTKKEKAVGLFVGMVLYYLYTVFKMYLALLSHFNEPEIAIYHTGSGTLNVAQSILFFMTLGTNVLVVLVIWAWLVFRKNNWKDMLISTTYRFRNAK